MKLDIDDGSGVVQSHGSVAKQIIEACEALPVGKLLTTFSMAERLGMKRSTTDHCIRELGGYTTMRKFGGRWRRLFGNPKTISALAKEDNHGK